MTKPLTYILGESCTHHTEGRTPNTWIVARHFLQPDIGGLFLFEPTWMVLDRHQIPYVVTVDSCIIGQVAAVRVSITIQDIVDQTKAKLLFSIDNVEDAPHDGSPFDETYVRDTFRLWQGMDDNVIVGGRKRR